jgi:hypothetical protein
VQINYHFTIFISIRSHLFTITVPTMKLYTTLFTLLLALLSPKGGDAFIKLIYERFFCPVVESGLGTFLGDNDACTCEGTGGLFQGYGMEASCALTSDKSLETTAEVDLQGRNAETGICIEVDSGSDAPPLNACLTVKFSRGFFNPISWENDGCTIAVDGEKCDVCKASGGLPLPDIEFDCGNLLPDSFGGF